MPKLPDATKIRFQQENPKVRGKPPWSRYEKYKTATTVAEASRLGASSADISYDHKSGFLNVLPASAAPAAAATPTPARAGAVALAVAASPVSGTADLVPASAALAPALDQVAALLAGEGRLEGALRLSGFEGNKSSINGVYARLADGWEAYKEAYEKIYPVEPSSRILFYHTSKKRWKIGPKCKGEKTDAFFEGQDEGSVPPLCDGSGNACWHVYDEERNHNHVAVTCSWFRQPAASLTNGNSDSSPVAKGKPESPQHAVSQALPSGMVPDASQLLADHKNGGAASSTGGMPATHFREAFRSRSPRARQGRAGGAPATMVCAKMMVRSGFLCPCHYAENCQRRDDSTRNQGLENVEAGTYNH